MLISRTFATLLLAVVAIGTVAANNQSIPERIKQKQQQLEQMSGEAKIQLLEAIIDETKDSLPDIAEEYSRELLQLLSASKEPKRYAKALQLLTSIYVNTSQYAAAAPLIEQSLGHAEEHHLPGLTVQSLLSRSVIQRDKGKLDVSFETLQEALSTAEETQDPELIAKVLYQQAIIHYFRGELMQSESLLQRARDHFEETENKLWISKADNILGILYGTQGLYEESLDAMLRSYDVVKELDDVRKQGVLLNNIALTFLRLNKEEEALETYYQSLELSQQVKDRHSETLAILNISSALSNLERYDESLVYAEKGLALANEIDSPSYRLRALSGMIDIARVSGDVDKVEELIPQALKISESIDDYTTKYGPHKDRAWLMVQRGEHQKAAEILGSILKLSREKQDKDQESQILEQLSEVYAGMGDYEKALSYFQLHTDVNNEMYTEKSDKAIATMRARFEAKEKDSEIALLTKEKSAQDHQIKANELALENKNLERNAIIVAAILIFIVAFLIYNRRLQKQVNQHLKEKVKLRTQELDRKNSELEAAYNRAEEISLRDDLTGLRNRRYLFKHLDKESSQLIKLHQSGEATDESNCLFLLIDIDHFKRINDQYGHTTGDYILGQFGRLLVSVFRQSDYVIRWGGEEFLVVMRSANRQQGADYAERLRTIVENNIFTDANDHEYRITCSVGLAAYPGFKDDVAMMSYAQAIDIADSALYCAKNSGRNAWVGLDFWNSQPSEKLINELFKDPVAVIEQAKPTVESSLSQEVLVWGSVQKKSKKEETAQ